MRVGLADDSQLFRSGLARLLNASGVEVVLQVGSGRELLDEVGDSRLDAAVIDIRMPPSYTEEGLETADELGRVHPQMAVLVLSTYAETAYAVRLFRQGSAGRGYLLKDTLDSSQALRQALERLCAGGSVLDGSIVQRLMSSTRRRDVVDGLTERQRTILHLLAQGYDDREIVEAMLAGPATMVDAMAPGDELAVRAEIGAVMRALSIGTDDRSNRLVRVLTRLRSDPSRDS